jgi:predicted Zn-dependent peptidase
MIRPTRSRSGSLRTRSLVTVLALTLLAATLPASAQSLADFEKKVTTRTLDNGWTFIIVERPTAPVFTFATLVDVGAAQEVAGITGLAHMFEHMAFKGTDRIGTSNWKAEKKKLAEVEEAYLAVDAAKRVKNPDEQRIESLDKRFKELQEEAEEFVVKNEFDDIIDRQGGVGLNAGTNADMTIYFYSLPSNKVELWAYLESSRFSAPVYRQFYKERDVVQEERRMRTESSPFGRLFEAFLGVAFTAHPYKRSTVGHMSDLKSFSATDAAAFYEKFYAPSSFVTVLVGDVKATEVLPIIESYFGRIPARDPAPPLRTIEPEQKGERMVKLPDPSQPIYAVGYHRPGVTHPDNVVFEAMDTILGDGRTSRLYRSLVRDKQVAAFAQTANGLPGSKYPNLFGAFAAAAKGRTNDEVQEAMDAEFMRLTMEEVSDEELKMVKARAKADLVRGLTSNNGLAFQLAIYQTQLGDWRELFRSVDNLEKVTKADILRVARDTFKPTNKTVAFIETEKKDDPKPTPAGQ